MLSWSDPDYDGELKIRIYKGKDSISNMRLWKTVDLGTEGEFDLSPDFRSSPPGTVWYYKLTSFDPAKNLESKPTEIKQVTN